jgi:cytochrome c biogenesis protein CcdA/thiol-disulfide isomerase/thioredoxin
MILLVAFISGALSVLTPCVLPLLPAILASSAGGGRRRPIGIVIGLVTSFTLALLAFSAIVRALGIPTGTLRWISVVLLIAFGAVLLIPPLERAFERLAGKLARFAPKRASSSDGFWSGIAVGAGLGVVWAPCVGPILGGVAVASSTSATGLDHVLRAVAFGLGMSLPLLAITFGGRRAGTSLRRRVNPRVVQIIAGTVFVITGLMIALNLDAKVNKYLADTTGISSTLVAGLERDVLEDDGDTPRFGALQTSTNSDDTSDLPDYGPAPEFGTATQWINTPGERALTVKELKGKVVLVDFWTYSCINCIRTLPYLTDWHKKYADDGLVIVGMHAPEFEFEKDEGNVRDAVKEFGIKYPVAMDNDFATWNNYDNQYWPAKYLIDRDGNVRYAHFGEGEYEQTEQHIRDLLGVDKPMGAVKAADENQAASPETYLGYERAENFRGTSSDATTDALVRDRATSYKYPTSDLDRDEWSLNGTWTVEDERAVAGRNASLQFHYRAADVFLVLGPAKPGVVGTVRVKDDTSGKSTSVRVDKQKLYILRESDRQADGTLNIDVPPGIAAYAFTFG